MYIADNSKSILEIPQLKHQVFANNRPFSSESIEFYTGNQNAHKRKPSKSPSPLRTSRNEIDKHGKLIFSESLNPHRYGFSPKPSLTKHPSIRQLVFHRKENKLSPYKKSNISISSSRRSIIIPTLLPLQAQLSWSRRNKKRNKKICERESSSHSGIGKRNDSPQTPQFHNRMNNKKNNTLPSQADNNSHNLYMKQKNFTPKSEFTINSFRIMKKLGKGCFGEVFLAQDKKTGFMVALKLMEKKKIVGENYVNQVIRETKIQLFISNPYVAELYGVFDDENFIYLIMELCPDQSLYSMIRREHKIQENKVKSIIFNVCHGLKALHSQTVIHRDLKPQNIMISFGEPKITDFGWAVYCGADGAMRDTLSGSPLYHSPELVERKMYDEKVDIWAVGMLTYECLFGMTPFKVYSLMNLHRIVQNQLTFPEYVEISNNAKNFIMKCLEKTANNRPTIHRLLSHEFICEVVTD